MNEHADQPVTQAEFTAAMGAIKQDFDGLRDEVKELKNEMATKADLAKLRDEMAVMKDDMASMKDEIIRHFNVVAENIHQDVAAANADRVSLLEDQREEHEARLTTVEQRLGLRP